MSPPPPSGEGWQSRPHGKGLLLSASGEGCTRGLSRIHESAGTTRNNRMDPQRTESFGGEQRDHKAKLPWVAGIIGLLTAILYWIFADTPVQCVGRVVCQSDDRFMVGILFGVLAAVVAWFVVQRLYLWVLLPKMNPGLAAIEQTAAIADAKIKYEKNKELREGKWDSVPKVVCPHCQEVGKVEKFVQPEQDTSTEGMLKAGLKGHLLPEEMHRGTKEFAIEETRKAHRKREVPNMRCSNCTVEWRV